MRYLKTVLLRHDEPGGGHHYDWMIENPAPDPANAEAGGASLVTWRVDFPSRQWGERGTMDLTPLKPHRRAYLTYEGPISRGRGSVRRVDQGSAAVRAWSPSEAVVDVNMTHFTGTLRLNRTAPHHWTAVVSPTPAE